MSDLDIREAERRHALGTPLESRWDRKVVLQALATVLKKSIAPARERLRWEEAYAHREFPVDTIPPITFYQPVPFNPTDYYSDGTTPWCLDRMLRPISWRAYSYLMARPNYQEVGKSMVEGFFISTVWLGNHHGGMGQPPIVFETMIFPGIDAPPSEELEGWCMRHSSEALAEKMHVLVVDAIRLGARTTEDIDYMLEE